MEFTAENSIWDLVLLREAALKGDIKIKKDNGEFAESREEIEEEFGKLFRIEK